MPLTRMERFRLKSQLCDAVERDSAWTVPRLNMLLTEFGLPPLGGTWDTGDTLEEHLGSATDKALLEMTATVLGRTVRELRDDGAAPDTGAWRSGQVRLFISHSEAHREFASDVARELGVVGVHGFVAQEAIAVSKPWQEEIEQALGSMHALVLLAHAEAIASPWCNQEVGWAQGRGVPVFVIRLGVDPEGVLSSRQWPSGVDLTARQVANQISKWLSTIDELGEVMVSGLFSALQGSGDYLSSGATSERIASLSGLTEDQWSRLDQIFWSNDQVFGCRLAHNALGPFYKAHGRTFPPENPTSN